MSGHTEIYFNGSTSDFLGFTDRYHQEKVLVAAGQVLTIESRTGLPQISAGGFFMRPVFIPVINIYSRSIYFNMNEPINVGWKQITGPLPAGAHIRSAARAR